jgi:hypothetical protein
VRRGAYHDRASIRIGSAPDRLNKQEKLFGEHGLQLLKIDFRFLAPSDGANDSFKLPLAASASQAGEPCNILDKPD